MQEEEIYYTLALTRMMGFNFQTALLLYRTLGSGKAVYEHRLDLGDVMPDATPRLRESMKNWDEALKRSVSESVTMLPSCSIIKVRQTSIKAMSLIL